MMGGDEQRVLEAITSIADSLKELLVIVKEARAEESREKIENAKPKCGYCVQTYKEYDFDEHLKVCSVHSSSP